MSRRIFCKKCGDAYPTTLDKEDVEDGWQQRLVWQAVQKPVEHFIVINGQRVDLDSLVCDLCNAAIKDGDTALLVTMYRARMPMESWEHEYAVRKQ